MSDQAPASHQHDGHSTSSNSQGARSLNDTHRADQHMSLEGKLHETEAALNEVAHVLQENERKVHDRQHLIDDLRHQTEHLKHEAALFDAKTDSAARNH
ncbi:hypothetical protein RvY_09209-2 [Ramazzottius varieornatus]|uniref:V-SNARE coiled-coil homology domain-containing protein n=1 Tax=Ramazzottius varieornatus TaxID=947166 RepID=A0A1D1VB17_RAMVA|nr:hypothetical protein RvY_09209-2 [Ramazzottius varieornatus]